MFLTFVWKSLVQLLFDAASRRRVELFLLDLKYQLLFKTSITSFVSIFVCLQPYAGHLRVEGGGWWGYVSVLMRLTSVTREGALNSRHGAPGIIGQESHQSRER